MPLRVSTDASPGVFLLSGALALSPKAAQTLMPQIIQWQMQVSVANQKPTPVLSPEYQAIKDAYSNFKRLSYLTLAETEGSAKTTVPGRKKHAWISLITALLAGFIGGIMLNLMPCVLPVIGIKIMGLVTATGQSKRRLLALGLAYAGGVVSSMLGLAGCVILLRAFGYQLGWGFQFQHPAFVLALLLAVYLLALGLFELYSISLPGTSRAAQVVDSFEQGYLRQFCDGVLTTALSTPCTAPFLGTALIAAFTQPAAVTILLFLSIGAGLALPYVLLSVFPPLTSWLPAGGVWMQRLKQFFGFILLGTALWLLFILNRLTGDGAIWSLGLMLLLFFAFWLRSWTQFSSRTLLRRVGIWGGILLCGGFVYISYPLMLGLKKNEAEILTQQTNASVIEWRAYSEELIDALRMQQKPAFLMFTADWCLTCKANEWLVINRTETEQALREFGITPVKADWTRGDEIITQALKRYGGQGVPLYVLLSGQADVPPLVLPTVITVKQLKQSFKKVSMGSAG